MPYKSPYKNLGDSWTVSKENFLVSYAVEGSMQNKFTGTRYGMPALHPISGPVPEPSPLNTRYQMLPDASYRVPVLVSLEESAKIGDETTYN